MAGGGVAAQDVVDAGCGVLVQAVGMVVGVFAVVVTVGVGHNVDEAECLQRVWVSRVRPSEPARSAPVA